MMRFILGNFFQLKFRLKVGNHSPTNPSILQRETPLMLLLFYTQSPQWTHKRYLAYFPMVWSPLWITEQFQPFWFYMVLTGSCLWRGGESYFILFFITSPLFKLLSLKFKCQPGRERVGDREREEELRSAGRKPLKTHRHASPIQPDELLKSKMTFCNNTLYSYKV